MAVEDRADYFSPLFAVLYHRRGDEQYKQAVLNRTRDGAALVTVAAAMDFPAGAAGLLRLPPKEAGP